MEYSINRGINRPIEFKGLQAQYITYLGLGSVALLILFAVLYLLGVNSFLCVAIVLGTSAAMIGYLYKLSNVYGAHGLMKKMAAASIPRKITVRDLDDRLPLLGVDRDCLLSRRGDITVVFKVNHPEIFSLSENQLKALHAIWVKILRLLPPHTVLHKQDWFVQKRFRPPDKGKNKTFLTCASDHFCFERFYLEHDGYLFITLRADERRHPTSASSSLLHPYLVPAQDLDPQRVQAFLDSVAQLERILNETGLIQLERLTESPIVHLVERYCFLQDHRLQRDLSFKDGLRIGNQHCQFYSLAGPDSLPSACSPWMPYAPYSTERSILPVGFGSAIGQLLPCNHIYNQYILVGEAQKTIRELERKRRRLQSLSTYSRGNAVARDAIDAYLQEAAKDQRLPVKAHFNVMVWTDSQEGLRDIRSKVGTALSQIDAVVKEETVGAPQQFWSGIPGNAGELPLNDTFDTFAEQAACFLNQETRYRSSLSPVGIRLGDRQTGNPVDVDLFDEPIRTGICGNRNAIVSGPSGGGKSMVLNHIIRTRVEQGAHACVADIGHSYAGLCELMGGYYFTCSEKQPLCFNPFYTEGGGAPDQEKRDSIKALLVALWKKDNETFRQSEYVALSESIKEYYEYLDRHREVFPGFNSFYTFLKEEFAVSLKDRKVQDRDFDVNNFLFVLRPYYSGGEFDTLLNARENLDLLGQRFIVFELDQIKDHPILFPVVTIIIMEVFIAKMRRLKGVSKIMVIDEAWKSITKEGMAEYIRYVYKTARKFNAAILIASQELEDLISSPIVKQAIINNADCKILLDQSKYLNKFDTIQELLGLTDHEKALVLSLNKANEPGRKYKEVFISLGGKVSKVYRVELSPEEYLAYTTEESEKIKVQEAARRYGSLKNGIRALLASLVLILFCAHANAQIPVVGIIQTVVKKVITAMDIKVQQLQLETMDLQDAQKETENVLSQNELTDITNWVQQEKDLYSEYYAELWEVKEVLSAYQRVKDILNREQQAAQACHQAVALFKEDNHFSALELQQISAAYAAFLDESARNLDQLTILVTGSTTQMSDGRRLGLIDEAARSAETNYTQVQTFTQTQVTLSLRRARNQQDLEAIEQLYGLN